MTEHGGHESLGVVLHGDARRGAPARGGLRVRRSKIPDLVARDRADRAADARAARQRRARGLPSGRDDLPRCSPTTRTS